MKLGILAAGITPDELLDSYGAYTDMLIELLDNAYTGFEYQIFAVRDNQFPSDIELCDGWIITGSKANVYENLPWMQRLQALIREIYAADKPLVGICFGHQIIATAFGGCVEKFSGGWGIGLHSYQLTNQADFVADVSEIKSFALAAMHQDQVVTKPDNAQVFAHSDFCQHAGLIYDKRILTLQAHPEFGLEFEKAFVELRSSVVPTAAIEQAKASLNALDAKSDATTVAVWIARFLRQERA